MAAQEFKGGGLACSVVPQESKSFLVGGVANVIEGFYIPIAMTDILQLDDFVRLDGRLTPVLEALVEVELDGNQKKHVEDDIDFEGRAFGDFNASRHFCHL